MKLADVLPGAEAVVLGDGDLAFDGRLRSVIGERVQIVKLTKGGMAEVRYAGRSYSVPPRNLEPAL